MNVPPISNRKLDPIGEWLLTNGFHLTRENWIEVNWFGKKAAGDLVGEEFCEIPRYLSSESDPAEG